MLATLIYGERDIRVEEVPDPTISTGHDAVVKVVASCVCGSDLWSYRGIRPPAKPSRIGHEFIGVIDALGDQVTGLAVGDFVIAPFYQCCGRCVHCANGVSTSCVELAWWGDTTDKGPSDGGQGQYVRVPMAQGTLFRLDAQPEPALIPHLLTLSDVMGTGHHAAVSAGVGPGASVAVVGDGAVGLCGIIAAKRLGATQIIAMSRHTARQALAKEFGATHIVAERGKDGVARVMELTDGAGADCVLECVGTKESMDQATRSARPGGMVGFVGVPAGGPELNIDRMFYRNVGVHGGVAPVRGYMAQLLPDVLSGTITPGRVFDLELPLTEAAEAYAAMDERRATKVLLRP